jgi:hypothetical protein
MGVWTVPDPASQMAGVLIVALGLALMLLMLTAASGRPRP